jgi:hypothetical protein
MTVTNRIIKKITLYVVKILHISFLFISLFGPYLTNNYNYLLILLFLYMSTMTQWYLIGKCFLTNIECKLEGIPTKKYADGSDKSFMTTFIEKKFCIGENIIKNIFVLIPFFNFIVCLIKLYYLLKTCDK